MGRTATPIVCGPVAQPTHRLGVVGLGNRAASLLRAARASGRFEIVRISDGWDGGRGPRGVSAATLPDALYVGDWSSMLGEVDALVVAVPNHRHAEIAIEALEAGCHVFCEKPLAATLDDVRHVLHVAEHASGSLQVGTELRFAPGLQPLLRQDGARRTRLVWAHEFRPPLRPGVNGWRTRQATTGGTLVEKNCHHFDLFCAALRDRPVRVAAVGSGPVDAPLEHATVTVGFSEGGVGSLAVSMTQSGHWLEVGAVGDGWRMSYLDDARSDVTVTTIDDEVGSPPERWRRGEDGDDWDHPGEVEQFRTFAARLDGVTDHASSGTSTLWGHVAAFAAELAVQQRQPSRWRGWTTAAATSSSP
jgi:predicted dehydrogenase